MQNQGPGPCANRWQAHKRWGRFSQGVTPRRRYFFFSIGGTQETETYSVVSWSRRQERFSLSGEDTQETETASLEVWQTRVRTDLVRGDTQGHGWSDRVMFGCAWHSSCSVRVILGYILLGVIPMDMVSRGWFCWRWHSGEMDKFQGRAIQMVS